MSTEQTQIFHSDQLHWKEVDVRGTPMMEARTMNGEHGIYSAFYRLPRGTEIRPHRHESWVQVMVIEGCMRVTAASGTELIKAGDCYVVPPGGRHAEQSVEDTLVLVVSPDP
ncbi:cupin domain-containing protein [Peristeroidobacter soli]|jgi:quercetin dioxygenase-like cupin family protein|uniref:cupin domain-containing protein n=1 Tax=Peristeroidobacter soli TaxID=2497877 RepID=UPI00101BC1C9|nr:cupin domain-containing protein [Peristeroidobacter soli]